MKQCDTCGQTLAESVNTCPNCGSETSVGLAYLDHYRIQEVVHEGHASILYRATEEDAGTSVALRLFTADSGVDQSVARRLTDELEVLKQLPAEWFVQHFSINCSTDGRWYRLSEWVDAESWGSLLSSGRLQNTAVAYDLFHRLAAILAGLHQSGHFIPHLILNDILVIKGDAERVDVKIDYKLSRFLDPKMARPGQMLQNLLDCHPDITGDRPLDNKSDIWSLGRLFTQILSGDMDVCDPRPLLKDDDFPKEISVLIRSMLADDPHLRPGSMQEVADALKRLQETPPESSTSASPDTAKEVKRLRRTVTVFGAIATLLIVLGFFYYSTSDRTPADSDSALEAHADRYAGSIAFVMVQYQIKIDETLIYSQVSEGTAFLADPDGYLLTNRHVACPWLEDQKFFTLVQHIRQAGNVPVFEYQIYLWFEGDRAFNRLAGFGVSTELEDMYDLNSAYSRGGKKTIGIAGVARSANSTSRSGRTPLQDDFAVLKIDRVPQGLIPLPLDRKFAIDKLDRLAPVIALGFPLGNRTQADIINVSVTRGHIRRTFESFFQVDTSIYKGNSGGPIIDKSGKVIGIASAVATDVAVAPMPVITPLSDIGLVLPVTEAAVFLDELKSGQPKWNGVIDLSADTKLKEILELARSGNWLEALQEAEQSLEDSDDPALILATAVMYYCNNDMDGARGLLDRVLSIDKENYEALLLRALSEKSRFAGWNNQYLKNLKNLDWYSPGEFYGFLAGKLYNSETVDSWIDGWNTAVEKSWLYYIAGLIEQDKGDEGRSRELFRSAARAAATDEWPLYLALAELSQTGGADSEDVSAFGMELQRLAADREEQSNAIKVLIGRFDDSDGAYTGRREILMQIYDLHPDNRKLLAYAAFYGALEENWDQALLLADQYLALSGREEPLRLGVELLASLVLYRLDKSKAKERLERYCNETETTWYRQICETLLDKRSLGDLIEKSGTVPEKVLTASTYLGFKAEADGNRDRAVKYYREALGSYRDTWIEFEFAKYRYIKLRQQEKHK